MSNKVINEDRVYQSDELLFAITSDPSCNEGCCAVRLTIKEHWEKHRQVCDSIESGNLTEETFFGAGLNELGDSLFESEADDAHARMIKVGFKYDESFAEFARSEASNRM
jgi:hypothetical protein